ncbi:hypothetical protein DOTSEDRAFT_72669 [Dothistroma septosporum NZE10]|uniref:Uncharacterized protein n=1 Tax=Dothistroma septosporum (strain NZE10 / CBS 128990) TaxID=675120 RepID=M2YMZ6_DOTSN|nr:hypothetical protein DOTSEDRAFT_72669 [Dothistroma septosporum NZE10]
MPLPLARVTETLFNGLRDASVRHAAVFQDVDCNRLAEIRFMCESLLPNLTVALVLIWLLDLAFRLRMTRSSMPKGRADQQDED